MNSDLMHVERDEHGNIVGMFACPQLRPDGKGFRTEALQQKDRDGSDVSRFLAKLEVRRPLNPVAPKLRDGK